VLVCIMFYRGMKAMIDMQTPPSSALEILVTAQRWNWMFTYPNGYVDKDLHVPVDVPVRLVMRSEDVIHSFFVPAFRLKRDIVPGRYTKTWFRATQAGEYLLFCAEYCGTGHSDMLAKVIVHPPGGYRKWLEEASNFVSKMPPAEAGKRLYEIRGCKQCHSLDGTIGIGPSFKGVYGHTVVLQGGAKLVADENYIRESIMDPMAKIVAGYDPVMPTYKGRLKDAEITAIIEFLKTLAEPKK
jgi:cytochrome c oxidase subunit 2